MTHRHSVNYGSRYNQVIIITNLLAIIFKLSKNIFDHLCSAALPVPHPQARPTFQLPPKSAQQVSTH